MQWKCLLQYHMEMPNIAVCNGHFSNQGKSSNAPMTSLTFPFNFICKWRKCSLLHITFILSIWPDRTDEPNWAGECNKNASLDSQRAFVLVGFIIFSKYQHRSWFSSTNNIVSCSFCTIALLISDQTYNTTPLRPLLLFAVQLMETTR